MEDIYRIKNARWIRHKIDSGIFAPQCGGEKKETRFLKLSPALLDVSRKDRLHLEPAGGLSLSFFSTLDKAGKAERITALQSYPRHLGQLVFF